MIAKVIQSVKKNYSIISHVIRDITFLKYDGDENIPDLKTLLVTGDLKRPLS